MLVLVIFTLRICYEQVPQTLDTGYGFVQYAMYASKKGPPFDFFYSASAYASVLGNFYRFNCEGGLPE